MKTSCSVQPLATPVEGLETFEQSFQSWSEGRDVLVLLHKRLSTTLSLETLLNIFAEEAATVVVFDSMNYRHRIDRRDFKASIGSGGSHCCEYQLSVEGCDYGQISFYRRSKFFENELGALENLITALIFPLRNACRFMCMEQAALTDALTGVGNKRAMNEDLSRATALANRHATPWSLVICDLDHFKCINDTYGHLIGDRVLTLVAEEIERSLRSSDTVYRFGGEEFAILLPHTDQEAAKEVADRIRIAINDITVEIENVVISITASCGVARLLKDEDFRDWLARADSALYLAKNHGRNLTFLSQPSERGLQTNR